MDIFKLGYKDVIKGIITAIIAGILTSVYSALQNGIAIDWHQVGMIAITAGLGYLIKNFFTDADGKFGGLL